MPAIQFQRFYYTYYPPADQTPEQLELHYRALHQVCHYILYGFENCPTTGRFHHQGFFWLKNAFKKTETGARKLMPGVHMGPCRGSPTANEVYCRKLNSTNPNEKWYEYGKMPEDGVHDKTRLDNVLEIARTQGEMAAASSDPGTWARNHNAVTRWSRMHQPKRNFKTTCIYIWGIAGCGKTQYAISKGASPLQIKSGFFRGYNNQTVVVIDDIDQHMGLTRTEWLTLFDRYPLTLNVKGGEAEFNSKLIFVTSNFPPSVTFGTMWDEAMQRRFEKIYKFPEEKDEAQVYVTQVLEGFQAPQVGIEEAVRV